LVPSSPVPGDDGESAEGDVELEPEPVVLDAEENAIKMALVDHAIMIKRCLAMFAKSGNEILTRHHEDLQNGKHTAFATLSPTTRPEC
jgi:hypothetical protein